MFLSASRTLKYILTTMPRMLQQTDGLITMDAAAYNPAITSAMREWFAETGRKVYYAGPLITSAQRPCSPSLFVGQDSANIKAFLDRQLTRHGENSVLLVCMLRTTR